MNVSRLFEKVRKRLTLGTEFSQTLDFIFDSLSLLFPFERLGIALLEKENRSVRMFWMRSTTPAKRLKVGYSAPLKGSSLEQVIETRSPRIINDLEAYLREHPNSESTQLILNDGLRSSLTCPLIANGEPIGFVFFSSTEANRYLSSHVESFQTVADELSLLIEFGRLNSFFKKHGLHKQNLRTTLHDLKSPLSIIQSLLESVMSESWFENSDESTRSIFRIILKNSGYMFKLIDRLAALDHSGSGSLALATIGLYEFCRELDENFKLLAAKKNIKFSLTLADHVCETFVADPIKIREALENLVSNAVKFSCPGTSIDVGVFTAPGRICFSVKDQGQGIPEEELDHLFKEFGKTSVRPTAGESSSGLGLAIAKSIVESHGGAISAVSDVNKGSLFVFWLPLPK
jgi:signal transduction histidine kinase